MGSLDALTSNPLNALGPKASTSTLGNGLSIANSADVAKSNALTSPYNSKSALSVGGIVTAPQRSILGNSSVTPTSTGGTNFNTPTASDKPSLQSLLNNSYKTPNGGTVTTTGDGAVTGFTPASSYSIDTSASIPSSALSSGTSYGDLNQTQSTYQDFVNGLAQAQGYSPDYIQALQQQYAAQTQGAQLGLNSAALNSNYYTGNNLPGDTLSYAQGATAKAQAQNTLEQAQNSIQQLAANQALNTAQLSRTGNIAAAQTQLAYNPTAVAGQNAINQYNNLQQSYPAANIPEYNTALSPATNQQIAQELVSNSPAYRSQFQSTYQTPGGGTGIYNKLDVGSGAFSQNQDGSYTLVPAAAAALGDANANIVQTQLSNLSNINSAINASTKTLATTQAFMKQYGLNDSGIALLSQIQNSTNKNLDKAGAIAGLNADLNTLRSDYAQYLIGRGGSVAGTNEEAQSAIPSTISYSQLATLVGQMQQDGKNTADAVSGQVNQALQGIQNNSYTNSQNTVGSSGSGWGSLGD